jgi:ADP-ribose pyrophosphatase YjhB (NUDIX family)
MQSEEAPDPDVAVMVAIAIIRNGKVLVIRERDEPYHDQWVIPQGYLKTSESLLEAAKREVREELNMEIMVKCLLNVYEDFVTVGRRNLHLIIVCFIGTGVGNDDPKASAEAVDFAWIDPSKRFEAGSKVLREILSDVRKKTRRFSVL